MKALSLFSGAMGLDIGLERAGIEVVACCEIDKWCCETIRKNRPDIRVYEGSVSELDPISVAKDVGIFGTRFLLVGGPPCQSFSSAGKRSALNDPRGNLIFEYFRFVRALQPDAFIFENVGNLLTAALKHRPIHLRPGKNWNLAKYSSASIESDGENDALEESELSGSAFRYLLDEILSLGYSITFGVVNAADYGAAQKRIRFCMLGFRDVKALGLPAESHGEGRAQPYVSLSKAIGNLAGTKMLHSQYTEDVAKFFRKIPPGGNWRALSLKDQKSALGGSFEAGGGKTGFMRRLAWDVPAPTLTTKANRKGTALCHPEEVRPLSVEEYKRIQGFPDEWVLVGAMNQQYQQVGNAVPTQLGEALGKHVLETLRRKNKKQPQIKSDLMAMAEQSVSKLRSYARNNVRKSSPQAELFEE